MLITTETQYRRTKGTVEMSEKGFIDQAEQLAKEGRTPEQIKRTLSPFKSQIYDMKADVAWYENAKKGIFQPLETLEEFGRYLIALRLASGLTQTELAEKLNVSQAAVSQDEDNEYHGISVERAQKIMEALGAKLKGKLIRRPGSKLKAA